MSELRAIIRELLAEELAALRAEALGRLAVEQVAVGTEAELTKFALMVARRAREESGFLAALEAGSVRFVPAAVPVGGLPSPVSAARPLGAATRTDADPSITLVAPAPPAVPELHKGLITERDIAAIEHGEKRLRITKNARMTPLAVDEARRRGIRIERTLA